MPNAADFMASFSVGQGSYDFFFAGDIDINSTNGHDLLKSRVGCWII
jgi:hypothetical protein